MAPPPHRTGRKRSTPIDAHSEETEDSVELLSESEALKLVKFDPSIDLKDSWEPPKAMQQFLEKHF